MDVTSDLIDIIPYEETRQRPASLLEREPDETWVVRAVPVGVEGEVTRLWDWCKEGEYVRIPLFPYLTSGTDPAVAMGFAGQLGLVLGMTFLSVVGVVPRRVHISLGHPLEDREDALRFWIGFAFLIPKPPR